MFNKEEFLSDLYSIMVKEANKISKKKLEQLKGAKFGNNQIQKSYGDAYRRVIGRIAGENVFKVVFGKKTLSAFITEFGTGSLMAGEQDNPYLKTYLGNRFYNPVRSKSIAGANKVRSWGSGQYKTFNWMGTNKHSFVIRDGGNRRAGIDIETTSGNGFHKGMYTPRPPNFTMRRIVRECEEELLEVLKKNYKKLINSKKYYGTGTTKQPSKMFNVDVNWGRKNG